MENLALFLGGSSLIAAIVIGLLKKLIKEWVAPRFGDAGVLITLLAVSFILALGCWGWKFIPADVLATMGIIFGGAITIYQVLVKAIWNKAILGKLDKDEV